MPTDSTALRLVSCEERMSVNVMKDSSNIVLPPVWVRVWDDDDDSVKLTLLSEADYINSGL